MYCVPYWIKYDVCLEMKSLKPVIGTAVAKHCPLSITLGIKSPTISTRFPWLDEPVMEIVPTTQ